MLNLFEQKVLPIEIAIMGDDLRVIVNIPTPIHTLLTHHSPIVRSKNNKKVAVTMLLAPSSMHNILLH